MRAILYARVSSNDRINTGGENLQDQLRLCREYAQQNGYTLVAELPEDDRGVSGAELYPPQLSNALEMARAGQYDVLVIREIDRLARDITKQYIIESELKQAGVKIEYALYDFPDTAEGRLQKSIYAAFAEFEREKIKQRMVRGRRRKVKGGEIMDHGIPPYGYRKKVVDGKCRFVLHDTEARIVKLIFHLYTEGDGQGPLALIGIQRYLSKAGIPTPAESCSERSRGKTTAKIWYSATISKILHRESYTGIWIYGKGGENPIEVSIPAIIDQETFNRAHEQAKKNTSDSSRNTKRDYLLRRRLTCSCGRAMSVSSRKSGKLKYYFCGGKVKYDTLNGKPPCAMPYFRADHVDNATWNWLKIKFSNEDALLEALNEQKTQRQELTMPQRESLDTVNKLLEQKQQEFEKLLDVYLSGDFPTEWLTERKRRILNEIEGFKDQQTRLTSILDEQELGEERIKTILELSQFVRNGIIEAENEFEKRRWVIETLDVRGTLTVEDGEKVLYLTCIAGDDSLSIDYTRLCMVMRGQK